MTAHTMQHQVQMDKAAKALARTQAMTNMTRDAGNAYLLTVQRNVNSNLNAKKQCDLEAKMVSAVKARAQALREKNTCLVVDGKNIWESAPLPSKLSGKSATHGPPLPESSTMKAMVSKTKSVKKVNKPKTKKTKTPTNQTNDKETVAPKSVPKNKKNKTSKEVVPAKELPPNQTNKKETVTPKSVKKTAKKDKKKQSAKKVSKKSKESNKKERQTKESKPRPVVETVEDEDVAVQPLQQHNNSSVFTTVCVPDETEPVNDPVDVVDTPVPDQADEPMPSTSWEGDFEPEMFGDFLAEDVFDSFEYEEETVYETEDEPMPPSSWDENFDPEGWQDFLTKEFEYEEEKIDETESMTDFVEDDPFFQQFDEIQVCMDDDSDVAEEAKDAESDDEDDGLSWSEPKFVVLLASQTADRNTRKNQRRATMILDRVGVDYITIDACDPSFKSVRDDLFEISQIRWQYPQFFKFVDNWDAQFLGTMTEFASAAEAGNIGEWFES